MLLPLHPGIEPLGIFDLEDDDHSKVRGGEVGILVDLDEESDGYAADVFQQGPQVQIELDDAPDSGAGIYGLVDEGTSNARGTHSYGTYFGSVIGTTVGQGTGWGTQDTTGVVVVGPSTVTGSGKATLWTKPGLYGVTEDATEDSSEWTALQTLNTAVHGATRAAASTDGKLTADADGYRVAFSVGLVADSSLVSTTVTQAAATGTDYDRYLAIYLLGVGV